MNNQPSRRYIEHARKVAADLIQKAHSDRYGCYWKTVRLDQDQSAYLETAENLYCGNAGITLFLTELAGVLEEEEICKAATQSLNWLQKHCSNNPALSSAFISGRPGVAYLFLRASLCLNEPEYLQVALDIARKVNFDDAPNKNVQDFINGSAGSLLALLHLHSASNQTWIIPQIEKLVDRLLSSVQLTSEGLSWDLSPTHIQNLCGLSHGASGIGLVFAELAHYFSNPALNHITRETFRYENSYFNQANLNWPDFRSELYDQETLSKAITRYQSGDTDFLCIPQKSMWAWCHGAPGIGLTRLRACGLFKQPEYLEDARNACQSTYDYANNIRNSEEPASFCLCHGLAGNAELFLNAYTATGEDKYYEWASETAEYAIKTHSKDSAWPNGYGAMAEGLEDLSLFMGNAGVGYFFLRAAFPDRVPSILWPELSEKCSEQLTPDSILAAGDEEITRRLLSTRFPRTLFLLRQVADSETQLKSIVETKNQLDAFIQMLDQCLPGSEVGSSQTLLEYWRIEKTKLELENSVQSASLRYIQEKLAEQDALKFSRLKQSEQLSSKLKLNTLARLELAGNRLSLEDPSSWESPHTEEPTPVLLFATSIGVTERMLSPFIFNLLSLFDSQDGERLEDALTELYQAFGELSAQEKQKVRDSAISNVTEAISQNLLLSL